MASNWFLDVNIVQISSIFKGSAIRVEAKCRLLNIFLNVLESKTHTFCWKLFNMVMNIEHFSQFKIF
jgi:hypothetical protein